MTSPAAGRLDRVVLGLTGGIAAYKAVADDLLSTLCFARDCPLLVAPPINRQTWTYVATRRNVARLLADCEAILGPGTATSVRRSRRRAHGRA